MANDKEVIQYDFDFNVVAVYKNIYHVFNSINITRIYDILKLNNRKAYGYFWSYSSTDVMHEKRTVFAIFTNDTTENKYAFYNSINEAAIDTCINETEVFSSIMKGTPINGTLFIELCDNTHKILELDENLQAIAAYDKLSDVVKRYGISANSICYAISRCENLKPKYIKGKTFIKLKSYIELFTDYYDNAQ